MAERNYATTTSKKNTGKPAAKKKQANTRVTTKKNTTAKRRKTVKKQAFFTPYQDEIILITVMVISVLLLLSYFHLCGPASGYINQFIFGLFGFLAYVFPFYLFFGIAFYLSNRNNKNAMIKLSCSILLLVVVSSLLELIMNGNANLTQAGEFYQKAAEKKIGGGLLGGLIAKGLCSLVGMAGAYLVLVGLLIILMMLITEKLFFASLSKKGIKTWQSWKERYYNEEEEEYYDEEEQNEKTWKREKIHYEPEFAERPARRKAKTYTFPIEDFTSKEIDMQEVKPDPLENLTIYRGESYYSQESEHAEEPDSIPKGQKKTIPEKEKKKDLQKVEILDSKKRVKKILFPEGAERTKEKQSDDIKEKPKDPLEAEKERILYAKSISGDQPLDSYQKTPPVEQAVEEYMAISEPCVRKRQTEAEREEKSFQQQKIAEEIEQTKEGGKKDSAHKMQKESFAATDGLETEKEQVAEEKKPYIFPPIELLSKPKQRARGMSDQELQETARKLQQTLNSFGVRVTITNVSCGPAVTRYELQPEQGVKVSRITGLADDIKLNLAAADIRIEAPIPGKAAVGIEVPNKENATVSLRELLESSVFQNHPSNIAFAVGKDIGGQPIVADIAKMPHLLIAGATGSGKSVCINTLIMSMLYKADPADVKLIMVDPKVVELSIYNGIPHLLIPVVTDPKKASAALNWAVTEMTERYQRFAEIGVRDVKGYNEKIAVAEQYKQDEKYQKMPQIVIIVDELADLMMVAPGEVEDAICRLAQMARAAGLHLIIATQRPSVNVITGLIKANIPSRIAFSVSSAIDSRTILDGAGAEKLLGKGDMLFFPSGFPKPIRVQGAFISDKEVNAVVEFLSENSSAIYNEEITNKITNVSEQGASIAGNEKDEYFEEAGKLIIEKEKASIGMLQRVYKIGFNRAARIMDQLNEAGVVGAEEGTKPRKVLMSMEEFEEYLKIQK